MAVRESSDSITHLVKIVAKEVFDDKIIRISKFVEVYNDLESRVIALEGIDVVEKVVKPLQNANTPWTPFEDDTLREALDSAIETIAVRHGRTVIAIRSRIEQKILL